MGGSQSSNYFITMSKAIVTHILLAPPQAEQTYTHREALPAVEQPEMYTRKEHLHYSRKIRAEESL
jgi:hypothetical protein